MLVHLEYGRRGLEIELPDNHVVHCLNYPETTPLANPSAAISEAMSSPTGTAALAELARGRASACIVICDITRPVPNQIILEPLLATLKSANISRDDILILVATGMHRASTRDELIEMVGAEIVANYRIESHDGHDKAAHQYLGNSPRGVPLWIDRRYLDAELKITVGLFEPHFMAGFSGGRKLICPGIAALETIRAWHSPRFLEHPNARAGCLDGNPVHEENTRMALMAGCDFIVNVVIDDQRRVLKVVAGDLLAAFDEGVEFARQLVSVAVAEPVDIVVTSAAGYPLDATFYQAIKGIVSPLSILKPGGTVIIAAEISEGIGSPEFQRLYNESASPEIFMERILHSDYFVMDQWQLEEFVRAWRKGRIRVVTEGLSPKQLRHLFVEPAASVEEAVSDAIVEYGSKATIAVLPKGPYVLAELTA